MRKKTTSACLATFTTIVALGLAGCSFSVGETTTIATASAGPATPTVPADTVATTAEDALEQQVGQRPIIDCGTEDFTAVNGETRDCVLTSDPPTDQKYPAVVTLKNVDTEAGTFTVNVQVGQTPLPN